MSTSDDYQVPVKDAGHSSHPQYTAPEEMYWLSHMDRSELTEKYVGLRDNFFTLKKFSSKQEDKIKKLQTKPRKIISDHKKDGEARKSVKELEYEETLETQRQALRQLRLRNQHLEKKLKLANVQLSMARKNKPLMFRNVTARIDTGLKQPRTQVSPSRAQPPTSTPKPASPSDDSSSSHIDSSHLGRDEMLPQKVREILEEARERILALESEREELHDQLSEKQQSAETTEYELHHRINELEEEVSGLRGELREHSVREEREAVAAVRAGREQRSLSARCAALTEQLAATEEKVATEKATRNELNANLERVTSRLLSTEAHLREAQELHQKALAQLQEATEKTKVLKDENVQLQHENERLTTLNLSSEQRDLSAENQTLKAQVAHLESALQSDLSERGDFLEQLTRDKEAVARMEMEVKTLKGHNLSLQEDLEKTTVKLEAYKKAGVPESAHKDFTVSVPKKDEDYSYSSKEHEKLRVAYDELQLLYREKTRELEAITATIASHSQTYRVLESQVTKIKQEAEEHERELEATVKELREVLQRREQRCEQLEAQILASHGDDRWISSEQNQRDAGRGLTRTLELGRHDNMLEFHIAAVTFEALDFGRLKTFVSWTVPFALEDPLQHTNVAVGSPAKYTHSALYTFHMTHRNLESLRQDPVSVSVYLLLDSGHPAKVGECRLSFCEVLEHPRNTLHGTASVILALDHPDDLQHFKPAAHMLPGQVIGTLSYWFRLQRPCEDVIAQHLRSVRLLASHQKQQDQESKMILPSSSSNPRRITAEKTERGSIDHRDRRWEEEERSKKQDRETESGDRRRRDEGGKRREVEGEVEQGKGRDRERKEWGGKQREKEEEVDRGMRSRDKERKDEGGKWREREVETDEGKRRDREIPQEGRKRREKEREVHKGRRIDRNAPEERRRREKDKEVNGGMMKRDREVVEEEVHEISALNSLAPDLKSRTLPASPSQDSPGKIQGLTPNQDANTLSKEEQSLETVGANQEEIIKRRNSSGSSSVSSTGTYNIASSERPKSRGSLHNSRSNSVTSTGTYNVGSSKAQKSSDSGDDGDILASRKSTELRRGSSSEVPPHAVQPYTRGDMEYTSENTEPSPPIKKRTVRPKSSTPSKLSSFVDLNQPSTSRGHEVMEQGPSEHRLPTQSSSHIGSEEDDSDDTSDSDCVIVQGRDCAHRAMHTDDKPEMREGNSRKENNRSSSGRSRQESGSNDGRGKRNTVEIFQETKGAPDPHEPSTSSHSSSDSSDKEADKPQNRPSYSESSEDTDSEGVVAIPLRNPKEHKTSVYIEVCWLTLGPAATAMLAEDPMVDLLFVDYHGFLGLPPDRLETPLSLPKPVQPNTPLRFNFGQELSVDPEHHPERWKALSELMNGQGLLKFTVTSEPPGHLQDTHDCHDLGYVYLDLHKLEDSGRDLEEEPHPIKSAEDGSHLGTLTLTLHIIHVLALLAST